LQFCTSKVDDMVLLADCATYYIIMYNVRRYSMMVFLPCLTTWYICGSGMKTLHTNESVVFQVLGFGMSFFWILCGYACEYDCIDTINACLHL
jgi:hypothetical protein